MNWKCRRLYWPVLGVTLLAIYLSVPESKEPKCALDYTANMTTEENIRFYGYPYEKHVVQTEDGYFLNLIRLPRRESDNLPVLLVHGFLASSQFWLFMGPGTGLGYVLYDEGYDVWLPDLRGNVYSTQHRFLRKNDTEFWDFSLDEHGLFDQPAIIDYILKETSHRTLVHVGMSLGSWVFFIMGAMRPEYNAKIEAHISLTPAVLPKDSFLSRSFLDTSIPVVEYVTETPGSFSHGLLPKIVKTVWNFNFLTRIVFNNLLLTASGPTESHMNDSVTQIFLNNFMLGSSIKVTKHLRQFHNSETRLPQRYDYQDEETNFNKYGQGTPPEYDLSKIDIPVYIFYGVTDAFCPEQSVLMLKETLSGPVEVIKIGESLFNHMDFPFTNKANPKVLEKLRLANEKYKNNKKSVQTEGKKSSELEYTNTESPNEHKGRNHLKNVSNEISNEM